MFRNGTKRMVSLVNFNREAYKPSFPADEIPKIKLKFLIADYRHRFINGVINNFQEKSEETNNYISPLGFFNVPKKVVLVDISYSPNNEEFSNCFMKKFNLLSLTFLLIINTIFVLSESLRKLKSCLN